MDNKVICCVARCRQRIALLVMAALLLGLTVSPADAQPSVQGDWVQPVGGYDWSLAAVDAALLSTGKVLVWDLGFINDPDSNCHFTCNIECNIVKLWNPTDGSFTDASCSVCVGCLHCPGHAFLKDGSLLVPGGGNSDDPVNEARNFRLTGPGGWVQLAPMIHKRWYPTATTLADGRVLLVAGEDESGATVDTPEIYNPSTNTWAEVSVQPQAIPNFYPFMFLLPDGKVFYAGGSDAISSPTVKTYTLDYQSTPAVWDEFPANSDSFFGGKKGAAVMYEPGKILKAGGVDGNDQPINMAARIEIDPNGPEAWELLESAALPEARKDHNLVLLPDGKILLVGGHSGAGIVRSAAMLDPQDPNPSWDDMADMVKARGHHSTALLLPDATVLAAGGHLGSADEKTAEIYRPPYLYTGQPRPVIGFAPTLVKYGQQFKIDLTETFGGVPAADIDKVSLIRPASVTHWFDSDQRFLSLDIGPLIGAYSLSVTAPANANLAPPGYYMLFVVSDAGVPSVAAWVRVDDNLT